MFFRNNQRAIKFFLGGLLTLGLVLAWSARPAAAVNLFGDTFNQGVGSGAFRAIGFGSRDPRAIAASITNIAFGLLGTIAIILIIYGGFLWMTSAGDAEKIEKAKKLLGRAAIGLLIILAAWAVGIYVISRLLFATGAQSVGEGLACSQAGATAACGCGGVRTCTDGQWSACVGSDCNLGSRERQSCDSNPLTSDCDLDNNACGQNEFCDALDCRCSLKAGYGQSCDADSASAACQADNNLCQQDLSCNQDCVCTGEPVIDSVSPMGGFCDGAPDQACLSDADCTALTPATCNLSSPNGAVGNLVTISGRYFLTYQAGVSKVFFWDGNDFTVEAPLAVVVNIGCSESWSDSQIIVVVPAGAKSGPLRVVAVNGADDSNNTRGPQVKDFLLNNLKRPGLCNLNPLSGKFNDVLTYGGLGLSGVAAYFGSPWQNVKANNSQFTAVDSGTAEVPNLKTGRTTTYAQAASGAVSNFLLFNKLSDDGAAPLIASVEPAAGPPGQYVTIRGSGFGGSRASSQVFFAEVPADFNFPRLCSQSIWRDSEIIVKVPPKLADGEYKIKLTVGKFAVEAPTTFRVDATMTLAPGLCKVTPLFGEANEEIKLWGEYFGAKSGDSKVRFHPDQERKNGVKICQGGKNDGDNCANNSDCDSNDCREEISYWDADNSQEAAGSQLDLAVTRIARSAASGPVKIVKGSKGLASNGINLTIGKCTQDNQCGGSDVCCPAGTPTAGRCQTSMSGCYGAAENCVYEWQFDTGLGNNNCPPDKPNACQDGSCCRSDCVLNSNGLTTCLDNASCAGYGAGACLDSITCPNSPGNCSQNSNIIIKGASCNCALLGCPDCQYQAETNRCVSNRQCSLNGFVNDINGNQVEKFCAAYNGVGRWQLYTKQTCPENFTRYPGKNNLCIDLTAVCDLCAGDLTCVNQGGSGRCATRQPVCPSNFECQADVCTRSEGSCECCCDKKQNKTDQTNPACCAPLTCANSCGAGGDFGLCSGCADVGTTQEEHDAACNCTGTSGKYCDASVPGGVCRDCGQIGSLSECTNHLTCCVDNKQGNACVGVKGARFFSGDLAYCAYYGCGDNCAAPAKDQTYASQSDCQKNCDSGGGSDSCDGSDQPGCQQDVTKCQDPSKPVCNDNCQCEAEKLTGDVPCATKDGACSLFCGTAYSCRGALGCEGLGCIGAADESTCSCCCDPKDKGSDPTASDFDKCKKIGSGKLFCQANVGSCTGVERGLCCGAKVDADCGDIDNIGVGSDSCCRPRPQVESTVPANNASGVCRNSLIRVKFNRQLDSGSFSGNVIVVGDYGAGLCPANTTLLVKNDALNFSGNFLVRTWQVIKQFFSRFWSNIAGSKVTAAVGGNFCAVSGKAIGGTFYDQPETKSYLDFVLSAPLDSNIQYYVIIKGNSDNGKTGLLDINKIGFRGINTTTVSSFNGLTYPNAYIWTFKTGVDICYLDKVEIDPAQHLFRKPNDSYLFVATALDQKGNLIAPTNLYNWNWSWWSDNVAVATVVAETAAGEQATVTSGVKKDAQTFVYARATITADEINALSSEGSYQQGQSRIIVFICNNPWPPVVDVNAWPWRWRDDDANCTVCTDPQTKKSRPCTSADCFNNNFEFYYCRDQAGAGTKDDLPALSKKPPIRGLYQYLSRDNWIDVLKDFYFFGAPLPVPPTGLKVVLTQAPRGGEVEVSWQGQNSRQYTVYYGTTSHQYSQSREAGDKTSVLIGGLANNQNYYFAVTATDPDKAESTYSEEAPITVADKVAPLTPANAQAEIKKANNDWQIKLTWAKDQSADTVQYGLKFGPNPDPAVALKIGLVNTYTLNKLSNLATQDYYVQLTALDGADNSSAPVKFLCAKGCAAASCACQIIE